jgi:hypothetical protein
VNIVGKILKHLKRRDREWRKLRQQLENLGEKRPASRVHIEETLMALDELCLLIAQNNERAIMAAFAEDPKKEFEELDRNFPALKARIESLGAQLTKLTAALSLRMDLN